MTILIIMALIVLAIIFAVFFLFFKVIWLLFKKNTNGGPLIASGICTLACTFLVIMALYTGYKAVITPFQGMMTNVKANPAPMYGQRTYLDDKYPFELTVYDGMDFSKWITLGGVQLKLGIDTNAFKKDAAGKAHENPLFSVLLRQTDVTSADPFEELQKQLQTSQDQRRIELKDMHPIEVNGLPAYQAIGEAYSNRGKINFWLTAVQEKPDTVYYIGVLSLQDTPALSEQIQTMSHSFKLLPSSI